MKLKPGLNSGPFMPSIHQVYSKSLGTHAEQTTWQKLANYMSSAFTDVCRLFVKNVCLLFPTHNHTAVAQLPHYL